MKFVLGLIVGSVAVSVLTLNAKMKAYNENIDAMFGVSTEKK